MKRFWTALPVLALCSLFLTGCGDDPHARLRVVHASPDAPNVDVYVNGTQALTNVAYGTASDYLKVKATSTTIDVKPTGTSTTALSATASLAKNKDYTVLAVNFVASLEALVLADDNSAPSSGKVKVRIVHASPSAGPVDVYVTAPGVDLSTATPTLSNVPFKAASDYLSVPAGDYRVRVTPAGSQTVAIDSGTVTLQSGQIRTIVALDATGGGAPLTAIVLPDLN